MKIYKNLNIKLIVFWFCLPLPIFLSPSLSLYVEQSAKSGGGTEFMPISFYLLFLFSLNYIKFLGDFLNRKNLSLILFIFFCILSFFAKIFIEDSDGNPLLILVSIVPMFLSFLIGYGSKDYILSRNQLLKYLNLSLFSISLIAFLHLVYSISSLGLVGALTYRGSETIFNIFGIHQRFVYYPTILSLFFVLSLYTTSRYRYCYILILLSAVLMISSREAMLVALIGILSKVWFEYYYKNNIRVILYLLLTIVAIFFFVAIYWDSFIDYFEKATFINKFRSMQASGDLSAGRLDVLDSVSNEMSKPEFNFWFGMGFSMNLGLLGTPHNQYVEFFFRSGIFGVISFFCFILVSLRRAFKNLSELYNSTYFPIVFGLLIVFVLLCFVSFNVNTPVRAPYTGILFGLLAGFFNRKFHARAVIQHSKFIL